MISSSDISKPPDIFAGFLSASEIDKEEESS
jgi:hypothetical protein